MLGLKPLPWDYAVRNLFRRPSRTVLTLAALTLAALTVVVLMVFVVVGFIRGLEASLATSGDPSVMLVYSMGSEGNIETSSIGANIPGLLIGKFRRDAHLILFATDARDVVVRSSLPATVPRPPDGRATVAGVSRREV